MYPIVVAENGVGGIVVRVDKINHILHLVGAIAGVQCYGHIAVAGNVVALHAHIHRTVGEQSIDGIFAHKLAVVVAHSHHERYVLLFEESNDAFPTFESRVVGDDIAREHIQVGAFGIDYGLQTLQSAFAHFHAVVAPVNVGKLGDFESAVGIKSHAARALSRCCKCQNGCDDKYCCA